MAMFENFPYTDMHNLNLDWIIKIAKDFLDQYTHIQQLITDGEQSLQDLTTEGLQQLQDKADNLETLLQNWYDTHSDDIANQLADALQDLNDWYTIHQNYLDQTLINKLAEFNTRAEQKAEETIESIPADYTEVATLAENLKNVGGLITIPLSATDIIANTGWDTTADAPYANNNYVATEKIDISNYAYLNKLKIHSTIRGIFGITFYDKYNGIVRTINANNATDYEYSIGTADRFVEIPQGARYIRLTHDIHDDYTDQSTFNIRGLHIQNISKLQDFITYGVGKNDLSNSLQNTFHELFEAYNLSFSQINKYARYDNGTIVNYNGINCTDYIECQGIARMEISGTSFLSCAVIVFYDASHTFIRAYPNTLETTRYDNEIIDVPPNAAYFIANNNENNTKIKRESGYYTTSKAPFVWSDIKWVCFGDSLTAINTATTKRYYDYIHDLTGIETVNMGSSGTGYAQEENNNRAFYQRILDVPDADIITIFGSFNDLANAKPLGNMNDSATSTIAGCINTTIDRLFTAHPTIILGIIAPTPWNGINADPTNEPNQGSAYCDLLQSICKKRGIPYLDLFHSSGLRPWSAEFRAIAYSKDNANGIHPDEYGHKIIASHIQSFLETLLLH